MKNRALLSLAALSLSAACVSLPGLPPPGTPGSSASNPCTTPVCEVGITVTTCTEQYNDIKADPDKLYVTAPPNTGIHWTINSSGFTFVGQGIAFKTEPGKRTFRNPRPGTTDWSYDNAGTSGQYDYGIWLKGPSGTCHVDPSIMN